MTIRFGTMQRQIIKRIAPHQFVTHNAFQTMTNVDLSKFVQEAVDFVSYDSYPEFKVCDLTLPPGFRDRSESRHLSRMRGVSPKFMVLEQQSGPSGQIGGVLNGNRDYLHPTPKPGQMRLWCWNSIANGADGLVFFRWRSLPYGSEAHWNGLIYHDERNEWRLQEAKRLGDEIKRLSATLIGTRCVSTVAILYDYDNESHARIERVTGKHREANELNMYQALSERHLGVDVRPLSGIREVATSPFTKSSFFRTPTCWRQPTFGPCRTTWRVGVHWSSAVGAATGIGIIGVTMRQEKISMRPWWGREWPILP
jgi:beta-galactosidase